jgi:hypothetical protein
MKPGGNQTALPAMAGGLYGSGNSLQQTVLPDVTDDIQDIQEFLYGNYGIGYRRVRSGDWVIQSSPAPPLHDRRDIPLLPV